MPHIDKRSYSRQQLLKRVGHLSQVGGVQEMQLANGPAGGVRTLLFCTGSGLSFQVALDRGMDVGRCDYQGLSMAWMPPSGLPGPWYFDRTEGFGWLRSAMGGLINTCGLLHIGDPETADVRHYQFPGRQETTYGVHDRIAMTPARLIHCGERWEGDTCFLEASGEIRQAQAFGENLRLTRRYQTSLGASHFLMRDEVENLGYQPVTHRLLYHINLGFPMLDESAVLAAPFRQDALPQILAGSPSGAESYQTFTPPDPDAELQVFKHHLASDADHKVPLALINRRLEKGIYLIYDQSQLPVFLETRLMREGMYLVCFEPATNGFGRKAAEAEVPEIWLVSGEKRIYELEIGVLDGQDEIQAFEKRIAKLRT
jgi:hypothetical protein